MSEMVITARDSLQVVDGIPVHIATVHGNGNHNSVQRLEPSHQLIRQEDISDNSIKAELDRILNSMEFKDKPMLRGFLSFVVEETLSGRAHEIKGYTVATQVFSRKKDFDPTIDPIVRIQAGRLRRTLGAYYSGRGRYDPLRIEIGKGSYIPIFSRPVPEKPRLVQSNKAAGKACTDVELPQRRTEPFSSTVIQRASLAVMPLFNLTNDPGQAYLADGLTEELMSELARSNLLEVNASHSTLPWRGKLIGATELDRDLGVRFFLEGSLRRDGRIIKFTLRLIDAQSGIQVWGEQYKREIDSGIVIELQEEIARSVTARVGGLFGIVIQRLSRESRATPPDDPGDFEAFLAFSRYLRELSPHDHHLALDALEHAVAKNTGSGLALSMLSCLYAHQYAFSQPGMNELIGKAVTFARKGAFLEPQSHLVHALLIYVLFLSGPKELFFREAEQLIQLNPNTPDIIAFLGWALALHGEWERGLVMMEKGLDLNPFHPGWFCMARYMNYYRQGKFEEACNEAEKFNTPLLFWDPLLKAAVLGRMGKRLEATSAGRDLLRMNAAFTAHGRQLIGIFVKDSRLVQNLIDGLQMAGVEC